MRIWMVPAMLCLLAAAVSCSAGKKPRSEPPSTMATVTDSRPAGETLGSDFYQTGTASWYGDDFHGKRTANGEIYDMDKLTAAHQTLPFHTLVEVENLENGMKVWVRINDRGPFLKERIIDLSRQAAQRLGMVEKGTALVTLRLLRWPGAGSLAAGREAHLPAGDPERGLNAGRATGEAAGGECCVQAGAFAQRENAEDLLVTLGEIFPGLRFQIVVEDGMFKVLSPALPAAARCQEIVDRLAEYRLPAFARKPCPGAVE